MGDKLNVGEVSCRVRWWLVAIIRFSACIQKNTLTTLIPLPTKQSFKGFQIPHSTFHKSRKPQKKQNTPTEVEV
jgi:hypothetical protein